jgi:hypothetical protein
MPIGFWGDDDGARYRASYFEMFPGTWRHGADYFIENIVDPNAVVGEAFQLNVLMLKDGTTLSGLATPTPDGFSLQPPAGPAIPIKTADNLSVSVYGRRKTITDGGTENTLAEVEIDPEGAWYTPVTSAAVTMTNEEDGDPEWYEFTASASTAGGTAAEGMGRVVLRLKQYTAAGYFDWADMVVTAGGNTYNVDFGEWSQGIPQAVLPPPTPAEIAAAMWSDVTSPDRTVTA